MAASKKNSRTLLRCVDGFQAPVKDGRPRSVKPGQEVFSDDPIVKGREHLFEAAEAAVERATAEPGTLRALPVRKPAEPVEDGAA